MKRRDLVDQLAEAWYALQPASVDGREVGFKDAPPALVEHCYARARQVLVTLHQESMQRAA